MEIEKMTLEQIESHIEERKRVKLMATSESVVELLGQWQQGQFECSFQTLIRDCLDWTKPKQDFELELVEGMPCLYRGRVWESAVYWGNPKTNFIPFDRDLVGKAVE